MESGNGGALKEISLRLRTLSKMSEKSDRRAVVAYIYSQWIISLFGPWWISVLVALVVAIIIGPVNVLLVVLVELVILNTYFNINEEAYIDTQLLKDKLSKWWELRPWLD